MHKLSTAYTMYFNIKCERTGSLFEGVFKAKHVSADSYFRRVLNYIHGNHAALFEPRWKEGIISNEERLAKKLITYPYSSLSDYSEQERPESAIVDKQAVFEVIERIPRISRILQEARIFARQDADPSWQG